MRNIPNYFFLVFFISLVFSVVYISHLFFSTADSSSSYPLNMMDSLCLPSLSKSDFMWKWVHNMLLSSSLHHQHQHQQVVNISTFNGFAPELGLSIWDLYPPEVSCPDITRVGRIGDGGKWICGLSWLREFASQVPSQPHSHSHHHSHSPGHSDKKKKEKRCVVYSYGVSTDSSFEVDLYSHAPCEIHAFDPSVGGIHLKNPSKIPITFHKLGLSTRTGASPIFMFAETLFDTMTRLGHGFIDILKIDVEGAEWEVLGDVLSSSLLHMPFGQLIIELHFESYAKTSKLFQLLQERGFYAFSREINLIPCMTGSMPLAAEYSFINFATFFDKSFRDQHLKKISLPLETASSIHHHQQPVEAVIYILSHKDRRGHLIQALVNLYESFSHQFPQYPILIFHDNLVSGDRTFIEARIAPMKVKFIQIDFELPEFMKDVEHQIPERTICSPLSSTLGYRHMIRFHSFLVHEYLFNPQNGYDNVEFILRLDDDSHFNQPIGYDIFRLMKWNHLKYGFVNTVQDDALCVEGLWDFTSAFIKSSNISSTLVQEFERWKPGLVFYNNFEVSHASVWKHETWKSFMRSVDSSGEIYMRRWGDAPLHTIGVLLTLPKQQIHAFTDLGYRHDPFINRNATGLPKPHSDPFSFSGANCVYYDGWKCNNQSSNATSQDGPFTSFNPLTPAWSIPPPHPKHPLQAKASSPLTTWKIVEKAALFTFGHARRYVSLARTVNSFYDHFIRFFSYPIIIFHFSNFNENTRSRFFNLLKSEAHDYIQFHEVSSSTPDLDIKMDSTLPCGGVDPEARAAGQFFIKSSFTHLARLGYEWGFRFAADSRLLSDITYDVFAFMRAEKKLYGFIQVVKENPVCVKNLWKEMDNICSSASSSAVMRNCSNVRLSWPEGVSFYANFEISHLSVWNSTFSQYFLDQLVTKGTWGDSAIHTVVIISTLRKYQIHRFEDVQYTSKLHLNVSVSEDDEEAAHEGKKLWRIVPSQSGNNSTLLFHQLFSPQRFGWLGGDVAASFSLPSAECIQTLSSSSTPSCIHEKPSRFVWLFGDTLIGTSTVKRRIEGQMISSSVAILNSNSISTSLPEASFFWRSDAKGLPRPIFDWQLINPTSKLDFWPVSGLTLVQKMRQGASTLKVLVLGHLVSKSSTTTSSAFSSAATADHETQAEILKSPDIFSFSLKGTTMIVIHNPLDPPNMWKFAEKKMNSFGDKYQWICAYDWQESEAATVPTVPTSDVDADYVLLFGSYRSDQMPPPSSSSNSNFDTFSVSDVFSRKVFGRIRSSQIYEDVEENLLEPELLVFNPESKEYAWMPAHQMISSRLTPATILDRPMSEASIHYLQGSKLWLIVYMMLDSFYLCTSHLLQGPYQCDDYELEDKRKGLLYYAAKAHPELTMHASSASASASTTHTNEIVLSYLSNPEKGPQELFTEENKHVYTPQFTTFQLLSHKF